MVLTIIIQIILALMFLIASLPKFASNQQIEAYKSYGYPQWFRVFTAIVEVVTVLLLIIGIWVSQLAAIGGLLVVTTMIGAIITHIKINDNFNDSVLPIVLLVLGGIVLWQNSGALLS